MEHLITLLIDVTLACLMKYSNWRLIGFRLFVHARSKVMATSLCDLWTLFKGMASHLAQMWIGTQGWPDEMSVVKDRGQCDHTKNFLAIIPDWAHRNYDDEMAYEQNTHTNTLLPIKLGYFCFQTQTFRLLLIHIGNHLWPVQWLHRVPVTQVKSVHA